MGEGASIRRQRHIDVLKQKACKAKAVAADAAASWVPVGSVDPTEQSY